MLITELQKDEEIRIWKNNEKFEEWEHSLVKNKIPTEEFDDLKDVMLSDNSDITKLVNEAFKFTPLLFSEYIWYIATSFRVKRDHNQKHSIEIQELLGQGRYGKVSKCDYTDGNGNTYPAACKKCSPTPDAIDVFNREVQTLRQLDHLFVIKYLDLVEKQSKKFIVMELCAGSLKDYVEGKLERIPKHLLDDKILISQVALGIAYIHSKDIIHKDLKLANILLWCQTSNSPLVLAKIADFGFAKELKLDQSEFSQTTHPGTENYMAPELLNAQGAAYPASFASDVYAFGIIIARVVKKGDHPFTSDDMWRKASMVHGLLPQNLQDLSWDLKDLILRLMDNDPCKRPKMALVLRHSYFVLTNDRTKKYFVQQLWADIGLLSQSDRVKTVKKIFSSQSLEEWHRDLSDEKQYTPEEVEKKDEIVQFFRKLRPDVHAATVYPEKEYAQDIKEVITSDYDAVVASQIDQVNSIDGLSSYSLYKLVQRSPKLLVPYLWSHLPDIISLTKPPVSSRAKDEQNKQRKLSRTRRLSGMTNPAVRTNHPIISEIEWSSLFCEEEFIDRLWSVKYWDQSNNFLGTDQEIIGLVAKCNVSERVWSAILNQLGDKSVLSLLREIVQSSADNGPKLTQILLERHGVIKELSSLLHWAAYNEGDRAAEIVQVLLERGVDPNAVNSTGVSPIHYAAVNESPSAPEIIEVLLRYGANPYLTPLQCAARNRGDCADKIMEQMLDKCSPNENELNELCKLAVLNTGASAPALVHLLLARNVNGIASYENGRTLAHFVVFSDRDHGPKIMEALLKSGVEPNSKDKNRRTPLHYAVLKQTSQTYAIINVLLENGGDPNAIDEVGNTPVHYAATNEGEHAHETLDLLLSKGGEIRIKGSNGFTPVHHALLNTGIRGNEMRKLVGAVEKDANVRLNNSGMTLLHYVVLLDNAQCDIVQTVLYHGGNPNIRDKHGLSSIHFAIKNDTQIGLTILQMLLANGGDPNVADKKNRFTPVHYVANSLGEKAAEQMAIIMENKGDANASAKDKVTPMHLAAKNSGIHGTSLMEVLLNRKGNPNAVDMHRRTPLHYAIYNENDAIRVKMISLLLEKGGNPNAGDIVGYTPVHFVVFDKRVNSLDVLKLLVEKGGNVFQIDYRNMTPIDLATRTGSKEYCLPKVKTYLAKLYRNAKNVPESRWTNGLRKIRPKYLMVANVVKRVPLKIVCAIVLVSFISLYFILSRFLGP